MDASHPQATFDNTEPGRHIGQNMDANSYYQSTYGKHEEPRHIGPQLNAYDVTGHFRPLLLS
jgi:hypothetical protein